MPRAYIPRPVRFCVMCGDSFALKKRRFCADCYERELKQRRIDWNNHAKQINEQRRKRYKPRPEDYAASNREIREQIRLMEQEDSWYTLKSVEFEGAHRKDW